MHTKRIPGGTLLGLPVLFAASVLAGVAQAHDVFYHGRAVGVEGKINLSTSQTRLLLAENWMSCFGNPKDETVLSFTNPREGQESNFKVKVNNIHTFTVGTRDKAKAHAAIAEFFFKPSDSLTIEARALDSYAEARCDGTQPAGTTRTSTIAQLLINGQGVTITREPNQEIRIPSSCDPTNTDPNKPCAARIIVNEQPEDPTWTKTAETRGVTALHIILGNPNSSPSADIVVAHARAKIKCQPTNSPST